MIANFNFLNQIVGSTPCQEIKEFFKIRKSNKRKTTQTHLYNCSFNN